MEYNKTGEDLKNCLCYFKGKDCPFVADWLKSKGLHKLCSVFEGV